MANTPSNHIRSGNGHRPGIDLALPSPAPIPEAAPTLDLNTADVDALRQLHGIGRALAERIVQYRAAVGPFATPADLMLVPGISQVTYEANRARLSASPTQPAPVAAPLPEAPAEAMTEAQPALVAAESPAPAPEMPALTLPSPEAYARVEPPSAEAAALAESLANAPEVGSVTLPPIVAYPPDETAAVTVTEAASVVEAPTAVAPPPVTPEPAPPAPPPYVPPPPEPVRTVFAAPPAPRPAPAALVAAKRDWTGLMAMSVLSALLGAMLALLAVAGLNGGTLALNERPDVVALSAQLQAADTRATGLKTETDALRARLEALEGLSTRVGEVEASVAQANTALDTLDAETTALGARTDTLESQVSVVRAAIGRFDAFLEGLRGLLADAAPAASTDVAPPAATSTTAAPTRTPAATRAAPTATP